MKGFISGVLIGIGAGWLATPMGMQEMRGLLSKRLPALRDYLAEHELVKQYSQQVSAGLTTARSNVSEAARFAVNKARQDYGGSLDVLTKVVFNGKLASNLGSNKEAMGNGNSNGKKNGSIFANLVQMATSLMKPQG